LKEEEKMQTMDDKSEGFKYIVRIANTDLDGKKKIIHALTQIKGIGRHMAIFVADACGIERETKCGDLSETQIEKIREVLKNLNKTAPSWMLNHRKDYDTGEDIHLISSEVDLRLRDEINLLKMIRSYKGIRHELGLTVRGQRTRSNNRKGLALGVSRKRK
jgi:small subunit ribosomal protein S13